jgi:hypothetical protein
VSICDPILPLCVYVYIYTLTSNFEFLIMGLGMYVVATEPISRSYFANPSRKSVCLYLYHAYHCKATALINESLLSVLGIGSANTFPRQRIHATVEELLNPLFHSAVRILSKKWLWVCPHMLLSLLRVVSNWADTFPQQQIHSTLKDLLNPLIFYEVRVLSRRV